MLIILPEIFDRFVQNDIFFESVSAAIADPDIIAATIPADIAFFIFICFPFLV